VGCAIAAVPCCVTLLGDRPTSAFVAFLAWLARRRQRRIAQVLLPPLILAEITFCEMTPLDEPEHRLYATLLLRIPARATDGDNDLPLADDRTMDNACGSRQDSPLFQRSVQPQSKL